MSRAQAQRRMTMILIDVGFFGLVEAAWFDEARS